MSLIRAEARRLPIPTEYVQCVVTSPPYWGLRSYGTPSQVWGGEEGCRHEWGDTHTLQAQSPMTGLLHTGNGAPETRRPRFDERQREASQGCCCQRCGAWRGELGLEPSPDLYVQHLVEVFREVRRVLREDGVCWLNLGDSYYNCSPVRSSSAGNFEKTFDRSQARTRGGLRRYPDKDDRTGLKMKDLVGIPWRVAFALQQPYYAGRIKQEIDRAWLAALVDGEGCISILETTAPGWAGHSYPTVLQVRMCDREPPDRCVVVTGYSKSPPRQHPPSHAGKRDSYQWRLHGQKAAGILAEIYPFLLVKRKQAIVAWNHEQARDGWVGKNAPVSRESIERQQFCRELIRKLNRHEPVDLPSWMKEPPLPVEPGWYLRSDVVWAKGVSFRPDFSGSCMPESVRDRPTRGHEYVFLLTKSQKYFYDYKAVQEDGTYPAGTRAAKGSGTREGNRRGGLIKQNEMPATESSKRRYTSFNERYFDPTNPPDYAVYSGKRNLRSVWAINPHPFKEAHFATFPPALVEPMVKAGSAHWKVDHSRSVVLDPFCGSGTVGMVCARLGRYFIGCDLKEEYIHMARRRIDEEWERRRLDRSKALA